MRRASMFLLLFTAVVFCYGCTSADNTNSAGNANNTNTTTTNANTMNANANNSNGASSSTATAVSESDKHFVTEAAKGGMMEVELGRLATERGESAAVKQFGQRMVDDHTRANNELKQIASSKGVTLSTEMDAEGKEIMARLSKLKNEEFDRAYMEDMVKDHTKDVSDFQREASEGADKDVKGYASKTLPTLQEHLRMAQSIAPKERREAKQEENGKKK